MGRSSQLRHRAIRLTIVPSTSEIIPLDRPIDLRATLCHLKHAGPTISFEEGVVWLASRTPQGPATLRLIAQGLTISATAWGPGAHWAVENAPALVGADDHDEPPRGPHPLVAELHRRTPGLRLGATGRVLEALIPAILEQKVTGLEAGRSYRSLIKHFSDVAPGPTDLYLPPDPERLARTEYFDLHQHGIERRRAETIIIAARHSSRLEMTTSMPLEESYAQLRAVPGVGAWTAAEVARTALGDRDAVSVGDYHLPHVVAYALTGKPRSKDEEMLEILEPYKPQRARVIRLIELSGIVPPRRGPRIPLRSFQRT